MTVTETLPAQSEVVIIGGGPAGLAMALSLDGLGVKTVIVERAPLNVLKEAPFDGREIAMTHRTAGLLKHMGVWDRIEPDAIADLREARVENARGGEPLTFRTEGQGEDALGYMLSNHLIRRALFAKAASRPNITICAGQGIDHVQTRFNGASVFGEDGSVIETRLIIAADGRFSKIREQQGIGAIVHDFRRSMMVFRMAHEEPHHHVALQWFDEGQTFAFLPMNGNNSSIVFTLSTQAMARIQQMDEASFTEEIMQRVGHRLGKMELTSTRHVYPLKAVYAHRFSARRLALIGDAAVGMHPITAHGFNLGMVGQDILASEIERALLRGEDIGSSAVLHRFALRHKMATAPLFTITNGIAVLYARDELPFRMVRKAGVRIADHMGPLKHRITSMLMDRGTSVNMQSF